MLRATSYVMKMARDIDSKCRLCRRAGEKLFLKGDRCATPKCAVVKRAYPPGVHGKRISRGLSEYGLQLAAKQKLKRTYGVLERQFRKHFDEVKGKKGITGDLLLARLEMRLDNVIYRMNLAGSRAAARQLVSHGSVYVNGRKNTIPSYKTKVGDIVAVSPFRKEKKYFKNLETILENKKDYPAWISFDPKKMEGKISGVPEKDQIGINVDAQVIVEYYSR